jgi:hypothetical protein
MITFRKRDWDDKEYCTCGSTAAAVLEIDSITIPLCLNCVDDLADQLNEYNNTIFCYKCSEFVFNEYGWRYGGSCKKKAGQHGVVITSKNAGYNCCVDCLDTCKDAKPLEV